jgi:hypothetical protein
MEQSPHKKYSAQLMGLPNVTAVGMGKKMVKGKLTNEDAIVVFVIKKKPLSKLRAWEVVPQYLEGVSTDVIESGEIKALISGDPTLKWRPAYGGVSIGHYQITAGTLGCVVQKKMGGLRVLSNNHVLANCNDAVAGDPIYQPGPYDGGHSDDTLGWLEAFSPIQIIPTFGCTIAKGVVGVSNFLARLAKRQTRLTVERGIALQTNTVDCALMVPDDENDLRVEILDIGQPTKTSVAAVAGLEVQKFGRTTCYTKDKVLAIDATVEVGYPGGVAAFSNQIIAGPMSAGGDSGSLIVDMDANPVGLLFAGSDDVTICNEIDRVTEILGIEFV